jgi:hypothetical protein
MIIVSACLIAGVISFFLFCPAKVWSRGGTVGIVAGYGLITKERRILSRETHKNLSISKSYIPTLETTKLPIQRVPRANSSEHRLTTYLHLVPVTNAWSYTSTPRYAFSPYAGVNLALVPPPPTPHLRPIVCLKIIKTCSW